MAFSRNDQQTHLWVRCPWLGKKIHEIEVRSKDFDTGQCSTLASIAKTPVAVCLVPPVSADLIHFTGSFFGDERDAFL